MIARLQTVLLVAVLLLAGVLLGSYLLEWRGRDLVTPDGASGVRGVPSSPGVASQDLRVSVEVLNGAGDPGAARRITRALRDAGFDVKTFGNAADFEHDRTLVLDRSGRRGAARAVADALGVPEARSELRPELYLDATVILGRDWRARLAELE